MIFNIHLHDLFSQLRHHSEMGTSPPQVYHAYNQHHAVAMGLDMVSQRVSADVGLRYVGMASLMHELLPLGTNVSAYTRDKLHWGAITAYNGPRTHMTVTQMTTQKALAAMCD